MSESTAAAVATTATEKKQDAQETAPASKTAARKGTAKKQAKADVPKKATSKKSVETKAAKKAAKPAASKDAKPKKTAAPKGEARDGSKKGVILDLLRRPKGATLNEIMTATGWQAHSVRGFIAGSLKRAGFTPESIKNEAGERTYRLTK